MGLRDQLDKMEKLLGQNEAIATGKTGAAAASSKPKVKVKVKMTPAQAKAGVRSAPAAEGLLSGLLTRGKSAATKGAGGKALGLAGKGLGLAGRTAGAAAGGPLTALLLGHQLLGAKGAGEDYLAEVGAATKGPTAEEMLRELDQQRLRSASVSQADQNDPEMMEALRWMLSGQQKPDLTPHQVMFGATPTTDAVDPDMVREALAAMTGGA